MKVGIVLPHLGLAASPEAVVEAARRAEELGYDTLWITERLLYALEPQSPYPGTPDGSHPEFFKRSIDPFITLAVAATQTRRIGIGTNVAVMFYYSPIVLARLLTALDLYSGGRLLVGLGQGWNKDEFEAVGVSTRGRTRRADEYLAVLKAIWTQEPVQFEGRYYRIPKSIIQPKPLQKPHPPIYIGGYAPDVLRRAATLADGWTPSGRTVRTLSRMAEMISTVKELARQAGRDPAQVKVIVRGNVELTESPLKAEERAIFMGTLEQIKGDVQGLRELGVDEVFFDPTFSTAVRTREDYFYRLEALRELA